MSSMSPCAVKHNKTRMGAYVGKDTDMHEFTRMSGKGIQGNYSVFVRKVSYVLMKLKYIAEHCFI